MANQLWNAVRQKLRLGFPILSLMAGVIAAGLTLYQSSQVQFFAPPLESIARDKIQLQDRIDRLEVTLRKMSQDLDGSSPDDQTQIVARIIRIEDSTRRLEGILLTDAERLVSLPILIREVESLKSEIVEYRRQQNFQQVELRDSLREAQEQVRWILGTLTLGLLALIVPIIRSSAVAKN